MLYTFATHGTSCAPTPNTRPSVGSDGFTMDTFSMTTTTARELAISTAR
ncbi:hypothetical protein [Deinococcus aquaticus]